MGFILVVVFNRNYYLHFRLFILYILEKTLILLFHDL